MKNDLRDDIRDHIEMCGEPPFLPESSAPDAVVAECGFTLDDLVGIDGFDKALRGFPDRKCGNTEDKKECEDDSCSFSTRR